MVPHLLVLRMQLGDELLLPASHHGVADILRLRLLLLLALPLELLFELADHLPLLRIDQPLLVQLLAEHVFLLTRYWCGVGDLGHLRCRSIVHCREGMGSACSI